MKKISFILPGFSNRPIGGYKIAFEYANRLVKQGFKVNIVFLNNNAFSQKKIPKTIKKLLAYCFTKYEPKWFNLNKNIKKISYYDFSYRKKLCSEVAVATSVETVEPVQKIFPFAKKVYLIQDFEDWNVSGDYVKATFQAGFENIVISRWLKNIVDKYSSKPSVYIQNPIDNNIYHVYRPINRRNKYVIGMLYHSAGYKGSKMTLKSLVKLKKTFPKLKIMMFGTCDRPKHIPDWITYQKNATREETIKIYNSISIFVSGSIKEGFGLTGLEAMACGAALVTTNYDGAKEYAINNVNSLVVPVKDWEELSHKVEYLIKNDKKRVELARKGVETSRDFSWDVAYRKFVNIIMNFSER